MAHHNSPQIPFDKLAQDHWTDQETANARVVVDFFQHLMNDHDFAYVQSKFGDAAYTQHNRGIPNGIKGVVGYVGNLTKRFPEYAYDVKQITASGETVIVHSHVTLKAAHRGNDRKGFIITDTFRLSDGQLSEHWDAIQGIDFMARLVMFLTGGRVANANPTF